MWIHTSLTELCARCNVNRALSRLVLKRRLPRFGRRFLSPGIEFKEREQLRQDQRHRQRQIKG